ncbi:MAG: transglycosylase domain-containing protein [Bacteroidota bacterium]
MKTTAPPDNLNNDPRPQHLRMPWLLRLWIIFISCLLAVPTYIYTVKINLCNLYGSLPPITALENPKNEFASELYTADGVLLGRYFRNHRSPVAYADISPHMISALLATEDYQFEQHSGLYLKGICRAILLSVVLRQRKGGGSTITQQLAKNLYKTRSDQYQQGRLNRIPMLKTLIMKTKEWITAVQLERVYTKKEILTMYLNTVSFGSNTYGIKVAAKTFFNTTPDKLSIEQAAVLVGVLRATSYYSPIMHPTRSIQRRNVVLAQMYKYQCISQETYETLRQQPLQLSYKVSDHTSGLATYFRATILNFLLDWTKKHGYDLFEDGLKIYTTIDSRLQQHAEHAVASHMAILQRRFERHWGNKNPWVDENGNEIKGFIERTVQKTPLYQELLEQYGSAHDTIDSIMHTPVRTQLFSWQGDIDTMVSPIDAIKYNKRILHTGLMAMDPYTGHIKAWVGGINYEHFKYDHVMQGKRQPGSAFKPIVYAAAIDNGYSPDYEVVDAPVTFRLADQVSTWTPKNAGGVYTGRTLTLRQAMARSVNSVTAYVLKQIGPSLVVDYARRLGIRSPMDPVPALCLGASDVSIYELVGAYSTFMNGGFWTEPIYITRIEDRHGRTLATFSPERHEAISEETAWSMLHMLRGSVEERGTLRGLSAAIREGNEVCGKTGTTSNQSDGWCVGMTKDLCTGIWVGGEDRCIHFRTLAAGQGAVTALPIWEKFMLSVYEDPDLPYEKGPLPTPSEVTSLYYVPVSGEGVAVSVPGAADAGGTGSEVEEEESGDDGDIEEDIESEIDPELDVNDIF